MKKDNNPLRAGSFLAIFACITVGTAALPAEREPQSVDLHHGGKITPAQAREVYGRIELSFEANRGQTDESVDFLARGAGYTLFLKPGEAVFVLCARINSRPRRRFQDGGKHFWATNVRFSRRISR